MTQRADIINRIQKASSLKEQGALVADLDRFDRETAARHQASQSADWANMVVQETLAPATAHERSTHETDWLGEITASTDDWNNKVTAEAASWFGRTSDEVKADHDEFHEQAKGMARRTASAYGERMLDAEQAFLDYVSFLHTQAASGLPQVEQIVDAHENPGETPLPEDVFDTFGPPVHPLNVPVQGTESSERAPLLQEIESDGGGGGAPSHHDDSQQFTGPAPVEARPGPQGTTATYVPQEPNGSVYTTSVAIGHLTNLTDYLASLEEKEAASSLDQIQQVVDNQENPKPLPLNTEVAYPWEIDEQPEHEERSDKKTSTLTPAQQRAEHVARLSAKPDADLTETDRKEIKAFAASLFKTADEWTQGGEQFHGPGSGNSPETTPVGTGGSEQAGEAAGKADWNAGGNQPTYADGSSSVPPFVQGYSEGYGEAAQANPTPGAAQPGLLPPGAGGMGSGYQTHAGSLNTNTAALQVEAKVVSCSQCGKQDQHYNMQQRGNGTSVVHTCRDCAPVPADPAKVRWQGSLQVSAAFVAPIEAADPDFAKAYKYAAKWSEGTRLVKKGSASFEAGLYAGISDNPDAQTAWVAIHRKAATRYKDRTYLDRIRLHQEFTRQAAEVLPSFTVVGSYLQAPAEEPLEKTAGTSSDLDTMGPGVSPNAGGQTPINGPGTPPPLQGGVDPARPGGPAPYNGAEPFGAPAVPTGLPVTGTPTAIDTTPGGPVDQAAYQRLSPQTRAFRKNVQANLLQTKQPR